MKYALISAALAAAAFPTLADAHPEDGRPKTRSVDVYTGDLDPAVPRDTHVAYDRIEGAALYVCGPRPDTNDRIAMHDYRVCRAEAEADALDQFEYGAAPPRVRDGDYRRHEDDEDDE